MAAEENPVPHLTGPPACGSNYIADGGGYLWVCMIIPTSVSINKIGQMTYLFWQRINAWFIGIISAKPFKFKTIRSIEFVIIVATVSA